MCWSPSSIPEELYRVYTLYLETLFSENIILIPRDLICNVHVLFFVVRVSGVSSHLLVLPSLVGGAKACRSCKDEACLY